MKTVLTILVGLLSFGVFAQTGTTPKKATTCYDQWYATFKERGATPIADGAHDVIISIRNGYDYAECFFGKIEVKEGKLSSKLQVQKVDGTYEEFDKKVSSLYHDAEGKLKAELRDVTGGMSESFDLTGGEKIRLFFYKSLATKAKANKVAPNPAALIKN